jgi:hypothetical protein
MVSGVMAALWRVVLSPPAGAGSCGLLGMGVPSGRVKVSLPVLSRVIR